ncbi:class I SAM-dependent methyltransferase [bacterium]|nr:class I SAM-dependent methyltransferase [candidate division CSSED10-310 bacterium]
MNKNIRVEDQSLLRRDAFDAVAEAYDRARPEYPTRLVEDLIAFADIGKGSRVLEIGPGTGQLSVPLAALGAALVAVEKGPNLAKVARRKLSQFEHAAVVVADFDRCEFLPESFDMVVAATAFHWLDRSTRLQRCAACLKPGGVVAIVQTRWGIACKEDRFFAASQRCYARWDPRHNPAFRQIKPEDVPHQHDELFNSECFGKIIHRRYVCAREYNASQYCDLLGTFSNVLTMEPQCRRGFIACISDLIESEFGGRIVRHDMHDMWLARSL